MRELESLVVSARAGDVAAYQELVVRFQDMAVGYAYAILGDFHAAEDAAQDAFLEAFSALGNLREPKAFAKWLKRIVLKHCDRQTRRKRPTYQAEPPEDNAAPEDSPIGRVETTESQRAVLEAVDSLPAAQREVTSLFYINGYTQQDIASFLDVSAGVVKSRLHRARQKLQGRLMTMVADTFKQNAPDESFTKRVAKAVEVYTSKGPPQNSIPSEWHDRGREQTIEIMQAGEEGFQIDVALSKSDRNRPRIEACLHFAFRGDLRAMEHIERMMAPDSAVRGAALMAYAMLIHPGGLGWAPDLHRRASRVPEGIEKIFPFVTDDNAKVRMTAIRALRAYVHLGDERVLAALRTALNDPKHKVVHHAACHLGIVCPGCGHKPQDHWSDPRRPAPEN